MEFIPVRSFDSYITANIWKTKLDDAGINCYLKDEYTVTIDPLLSNAIGGIKLCVDKDQLQETLELLAAFEQQNNQRKQCPECHSLNVQYMPKPNTKHWLSSLLTISFIGYALSTAKQVYHCFDCGADFDESTNEELNSIANSSK